MMKRKVVVLMFILSFIGVVFISHLERGTTKTPLRSIGIHRLFKELSALLKGGKEDKLKGLEILARTRSSETIRIVSQLLNDPSDEVRRRSVEVLGGQADTSVVPYLIKALSDRNKDIRDTVEWALTEVYPEPSELIEILEDEKRREVWCYILRVIRHLRMKEAFPTVLRILDDRDEAVANEAADTLSALNRQDADRTLLEAYNLSEKTSLRLRLRIARILARFHSPLLIDVVRPLLKHGDENVRAEVATLLGRSALKGATELISLLLDDRSGVVREKALWALMSIRDVSLIHKVVKMLEDGSTSVRQVAGYLLEGLATEKVLGDVAEYLRADDSEARGTAARIIGAVARGEEAARLLIPLLKDEDASVRATVARSLGASAAYNSIPALLPLLSDADADVRLAAVEALSNLHAVEYARHLLPLLNDPYEDVRYKVASTLLYLQSGIEVDELMSYLLKPMTRDIAATLIVEFADESIAPDLVRLLTDEDRSLRRVVFQILYQMKPKGITSELEPLLRHPKASVRRYALRLLAELPDGRSLEPVEELANDRISYVRQAYVEFVAKLGGRKAAERLLKMLKDGDDNVKMAATTALGKMKYAPATEKIVELLRSRAPVLRRAAIKALAEIRSKDTLPAILEVLPESTSRTKLTIVKALSGFGRDALPVLLSLTEDESDTIRLSAAMSIGEIVGEDSDGITEDLRRRIEERLLLLLEDGDFGVRDAATEALMRMPSLSKETTETLVSSLMDKGDLSGRAAAILGRHPTGFLGRTLFARLNGNPSLINYDTISLIPCLPNDKQFSELLVSVLLNDPRIDVQNAAGEVLVKMHSKVAAVKLLPFLSDRRIWVVDAACKVIAAAGYREASRNIIALLRTNKLRVKLSAIKALSSLKSKEATEELLRIARDVSEQETLRKEAIKALGSLGDKRAVSTLISLLQDASSVLRVEAATVLGDMGVKEAAEHIVPLLSDPLGYSVAIKVLKKLSNRNILPKVLELTKDPVEWTREEAIRLIGLLGGREHLKFILPSLHDPSGRVRYAAAEALGRLGSQEHIPLLASLLGDTANILACPCCVRDPIRGRYPTVRAISVLSISRIAEVEFKGVTERQLVAACKKWLRRHRRKK